MIQIQVASEATVLSVLREQIATRHQEVCVSHAVAISSQFVRYRPVLCATWCNDEAPIAFLLAPSARGAGSVSALTLDPGTMHGYSSRELAYVGLPEPTHVKALSIPPEFLLVFLLAESPPHPDDAVLRRNPNGWATQPYESVNHRFLSKALFADVVDENANGRVSIRFTDGRGARVSVARVPDYIGKAARVHSSGVFVSAGMMWGCLLGNGAADRGAPLPASAAWPYRVATSETDPEACEAQFWQLATGHSYLDALARAAGLTENVAFLPPSLSTSPETGLAVWRKRTISSEEKQATAKIYELIHWTPEQEKLVGLYAEYRGPEGDTHWRFHERLGWIERPYIRWPQMAEKLGIEPWPVCAISPDGKQILYTCACDLRVVRVPD